MRLDPLYHWAPVSRRESILQGGLVPYAEPTCHHSANTRFPYICLGTTPSTGWAYSAGANENVLDEEGPFDLWQVWLPDMADVHVLPFYGAHPHEVRVRTAIPADHVWLVATRLGLSAIEPEPKGTLLLRLDRGEARYLRRLLREKATGKSKELDKVLRQAGVTLR